MSLLVIAPWVLFNFGRFADRTVLSTNDGVALAGSNCDPVFHGDDIGLTNLGECLFPVPSGDQSQVEKAYRTRAFDYMSDHKGRVPIVMLARVGRVWSVFRPQDMLAFNTGEDRERWVTGLGLIVFYPTLVAAIAGGVVLWRRRQRRTLWVLAVPAIVVTVSAALTYGQTRFRAAAEPSLALLAAFALAALIASRRNTSPTDTMVEPVPVEAATP